MRIVPVPCLRDNYAYLVICETSNTAAVVDPSQAPPVRAAIAREGVELEAIWNTHHHWDHTGGNKDLLAENADLEVIGHTSDKGRIPGQTRFVDDGDEVALGQELRAAIIHNPGHTSGAISYYLAEHEAVFTGDTLFCAGCGRLFEGTPAQMHSSLMRLAELPDDTRVYCGHEYTQANLRFAAAVESDSEAVKNRAARVARLRSDGEITIPSTIAEEKLTNPFLRAAVPEVSEVARNHEVSAIRASTDSPVEIFASLRRWKDKF